MKILQQLTGKTATQHYNDGIKFTHNSINLKCKWANCPNYKTQTGKLDKESRPIGVFSGNPCHMQRQTQAKNKGMEEYLPSKWKEQKKAGVAILVSDETDFKPTKIKKYKEGYAVMVKGSNQQEELTILKNICIQYRSTQIHKASS